MYSLILNLLETTTPGNIAPTIAYAACIALALIAFIISSKILRRMMEKSYSKLAPSRVHPLIQNKFFARLANLLLPVLLSVVATDIGQHPIFWNRLVATLLIVIVVLLIDALIRSVGDIYSSYEVSKAVPLRGIFQVLEIVVFILGGIVLVSVFVDRNPAALLGGMGAMTAIIVIIFKDAILGFISGIQLTANDMIRVGDTIEMPQRQVLGTVIDLSLITVKIEAHDKTIVAIPAYTLISEPFINRRSMIAAGARRIMRSFLIDANTVCVCDSALLEQIKKVHDGNHEPGHATNIGLFREYITAYLKTREDIAQDLTLMVRQLQPADTGIPLEVYAFATATELVDYEKIQSDIFDHIYTIVPQFGLRLYQRASVFLK